MGRRSVVDADGVGAKMLAEALGRSIKNWRTRQGLTQEELAMLTGGSGITVYQYERGLRVPTLVTMRRISDALGVPLTDMLQPLNAVELPELPPIPDEMEPPKRKRRWKTPSEIPPALPPKKA